MKTRALKLVMSLLVVNTGLFADATNDVEIDSQITDKASRNLCYDSGPVITNVKIVDVLWGPNVNSQVRKSMPSFFSALVTSMWMDGLSQYNSVWKSQKSTNQFIGHGSFLGQYLIHPKNMRLVLTEEEVQDELKLCLKTGHLPYLDIV